MFTDRKDAGVRVAGALQIYADRQPVICALPRGGVPVGYYVAKALHVPLYILVARKIGAPWNPEYGVGAIASGVEIFDERAMRYLGLTREDLASTIQEERNELQRRMMHYGHNLSPALIKDRLVIIVDDGLATGITAEAAIESVRLWDPKKIILAIPVGSASSVARLEKIADEVICVEQYQEFHAVGQFYSNFSQTSDEEVLEYLAKAAE